MVDPSKKVPDLKCEVQDLLLEVVDLKQEVPDLRSGVIPHNLTPDDKTKTTNIKRGHYLAAHHQIVNLPISNISFFDICCFSGGMKTLSTLLNVLNC